MNATSRTLWIAIALVAMMLGALPAVGAPGVGVVMVVEDSAGRLAVEHVLVGAGSGGLPDDSRMDVLRARPGVVAVDLDVPIKAVGSDPLRSRQWALDTLNADEVWSQSTGKGVTVAVLDSGVQGDHPDLRGVVTAGADFSGTGGDGRVDRNGHGTHVAGIIAAGAGNDVGTAGLAYGAKILPVQVLDGDGAGLLSWAAQGIIYAADHGAAVINMSFGAATGNSVLDAAVEYAAGKGVVTVAASGNESATAALYPAAHPSVIAVGATTQANAVATFSNQDPTLDVVAPGAGIASTCKNSTWCIMSGTSMAAPYATAAVASLLSAQPDLTPARVRQLLQATAVDMAPPGRDPGSGYGRIDVVAALAAARPAVTGPQPVVPDAPVADSDPFLTAKTGLGRVGNSSNVREVAALASGAAFPDGAETAVIARDDVFADSLTGAALAGRRGPVLYTGGGPTEPLATEAAAELARALPPGATVRVLGGSAAVSMQAERDIVDLGFVVRRVDGKNRIATAAQIADLVVASGGSPDHVLLARSDHWADAVTGSAFAADTATPVLLTGSLSLDPVTAKWLADNDVTRVTILGGTAAVSDTVAAQVRGLVPRVQRVGGANRAETAALVAEQLWRRSAGRAGDHFVFVEGYREESWAPAVAAAALSAQRAAPQLLVSSDSLPGGTAAYLTSLSYDSRGPASAIAVGGRINDDVGRTLIPLMGRS